jgi:beta-lactamase superfamily II metal-dependent hydrolase
MPGEMILKIWDVEHGACAMLTHRSAYGAEGRLAMIDSGCTADWRPSSYIRHHLRRTRLDYLFITNDDQDHMSDLDGLWLEGIYVATMIRNPYPSADILRAMKEEGGPLTTDIKRYIDIHCSYNQPVSAPFNDHMGGITHKTYFNRHPEFKTTNDLSLAIFIEFCGFKILFPGDLEKEGWLALLQRQDFCADLTGVDILVASHHGRENGYCEEMFEYCRPRAILISDKTIVHNTQGMTQTYRQRVIDYWPKGVYVATTRRHRHVLTTRRDGWMQFHVNDRGDFTIYTEKHG